MSRLKELREKAGFSALDLALAVGVSPQAIYYLEGAPESHPKLPTAQKIAKALKADVSTIWPNKEGK